jgi:hypothetical protein
MRQKPQPVVFVWTAEGTMVPLPRFHNLCAAQFSVDEEYALEIVQGRSRASHNHYFAALHEGWLNLAEEYKNDFRSEDHLRDWCLCKAGYCTHTRYVLNTAADARMMHDALKKENHCTIVGVTGNVCIVYHPESQARASMNKERFEESKRAVLDLVASMARTTRRELEKNAGRSA